MLTVSAYVLDLIRHDLEVPTLRAWLARVGHRQPPGPLDSAASVEEMRAEWDRELGERTGASSEDDDAR